MGKELSLNILEIAKKVKKLEDRGVGTAEDTTYDNTDSGLTADTVQGAIDELAGDIDGLSADDIDYDNTDSGLTADTVQGAVDELAGSYPADKVMLSDGVTSVEDKFDSLEVVDIKSQITPVNGVYIASAKKIGRQIMIFYTSNKIAAANTNQISFTIASEYRPNTSIPGFQCPASNSDLCNLCTFLGANGTATIIGSATTTYGVYCGFIYTI